VAQVSPHACSREAIEKILVLVVDSTVIILIIQSMSNPLLSCKLAGIANEIDSALSFLKIPCSALPPVTTPPTPPASTSTPPASPVLPPVKTAVSPQSSSNAYYLPLPKLPALRCKLGIDLISEGNAISPDESDAIKDFASSQMIGLPLNDANSAVTIKIVNLSLRHDVADDLINSSAGQYYRVETYLKIADPGDCHVMREALGTGQSHTNYVDITADNDDSVIDAVDAAIQNAILKVNSQ